MPTEEKAVLYHNLQDLPAAVRDNLPEHAQELYMDACNSAWNAYDAPGARHGDATREETAHKVAWSAVTKSYEKNDDGRWVRRK